MVNEKTKLQLIDWAEKYNDPVYFKEDPIAFPRHFAQEGACLQDIEIAAVFSAHFAWGRRCTIVRDCTRFFDFMEWKPLDYIMSGDYRDEDSSIHRTIKWSDTARICKALRSFYISHHSLEELNIQQIREDIYGQKADNNAPNKKINMLRRWMVRKDGKVDLGLWTDTRSSELIIPLDVHVYTQACSLGLTDRKSKDLKTALQITSAFEEIFPDDPVKGDFSLFGYGVNN